MFVRNRLKELRARNNLNQTELAKKAGISRQTVSLIERGEYLPSILIALKIARIFGEPVDNVFSIEEETEYNEQ
ncbi:MAG: helix-turn-helix transcriptional regulator [Streptococcus sp.]|nr:helix-turn-helix transcriptional regulator [Streptococcus sp.]